MNFYDKWKRPKVERVDQVKNVDIVKDGLKILKTTKWKKNTLKRSTKRKIVQKATEKL